MASVNVKEEAVDEEEEYESDPEDSKLLLAIRRRVASDDDEEEEDGGGGVRKEDHDGSDEEGAVEDYDEEDGVQELVSVEDMGNERERAAVGIENEVDVRRGGGGDIDGEEGEDQVEGEAEEGEKKGKPFAVPTAGAFYMHDDRFGESAAGGNRTLGAQKLWKSKDDRRWGHDKFEELTSQDSPINESRRNPKGQYRGRGRNQGSGHGYARGSRLKMPEDNDRRAPVSTSVKGRGPQRYNPAYKHQNRPPQTQNKQSRKYLEVSPYVNSARGLESGSAVSNDVVPAKKNSVASNLNSASPPFYPSGTSDMDNNQGPKADGHPRSTNGNRQPSSVGEKLATKHVNTVSVWKEVVNTSTLKKLSLDDTAMKHSNSSQSQAQAHPSGFNNPSQGRQFRTHGRGRGYSQSTVQPNHACKLSGEKQHATHRVIKVQNHTQSYSQSPNHFVPKQISDETQASSSPPRGNTSSQSFENGEKSQAESSKPKADVVGKAPTSVQGGAIGPFMYNRAQIMGASMGVPHGDPNLPTFLPVMQFGAQHPGGIGVPAVGMAFPGYVQPQHGQASSEMTWLPVLAGAAGALGATYCPPYMTDGSSYSHQLPDPQFASSLSKKIGDTNRGINEWRPLQKHEHAGEGFEQHQSKPRRYSEMKFGQ